MDQTDKTGRWAWRCQECGRVFKTARAAERAMNGDHGCPGCGGSDIDVADTMTQESRHDG